MIAVDANLLVYSHREDSPWHNQAHSCIRHLAEAKAAWAIPWPCVHEFLAIVTNPRIYQPPTPVERALAQLEAWFESPSLVLLSEGMEYWDHARRLIQAAQIAGPKVHDARIAALCNEHGVRELWSADRDFSRFPGVTVRNPLVIEQ